MSDGARGPPLRVMLLQTGMNPATWVDGDLHGKGPVEELMYSNQDNIEVRYAARMMGGIAACDLPCSP